MEGNDRTAIGKTGRSGSVAPVGLPVAASVMLAMLTAVVLLGVGFGRSTACTDDYSCVETFCNECRSIGVIVAVAHLLNVVLVTGVMYWLIRRDGGRCPVAVQLALSVVLVAAALLLTARGVAWD